MAHTMRRRSSSMCSSCAPSTFWCSEGANAVGSNVSAAVGRAGGHTSARAPPLRFLWTATHCSWAVLLHSAPATKQSRVRKQPGRIMQHRSEGTAITPGAPA